MKNRVGPALSMALAAFSLLGCAVYPGTARPAAIEDLRGEEGWLLLDSVPYVQQVSQKGCGAACLAMVLDHWGSASPVESLEQECFVEGENGIRASALRDAAKRRGLSAFLFDGSMADLRHELSRGRPVVVGLAKPNGDEFTAHFEVVVGVHPGRKQVAALDPAIGLTCDSFEGFECEWRLTKGVTLVVFRPEAGPVFAVMDGNQGGGAR
jgi:ABC-type bacteriocin/lantibiotic exporter with double-glycine peptidase domain